MSLQAIGHAHWHWHVNGVNPPAQLRDWLTDRVSLTVKLSARCRQFRVRRLRQQRGFCLADENRIIGLPRRMAVQEREVMLQCDDTPTVFAHTIVPLAATAADWPFFSSLGERSLGTTLFGDPLVERGALQFARLRAGHPLFERAAAAHALASIDQTLFARRCLFRRKKGMLLVTEVFLPEITGLSPLAGGLRHTVG